LSVAFSGCTSRVGTDGDGLGLGLGASESGTGVGDGGDRCKSGEDVDGRTDDGRVGDGRPRVAGGNDAGIDIDRTISVGAESSWAEEEEDDWGRASGFFHSTRHCSLGYRTAISPFLSNGVSFLWRT
jgi:hypothetical protein